MKRPQQHSEPEQDSVVCVMHAEHKISFHSCPHKYDFVAFSVKITSYITYSIITLLVTINFYVMYYITFIIFNL